MIYLTLVILNKKVLYLNEIETITCVFAVLL